MLTITIPPYEIYNSELEEFISNDKETVICLEHSLVSISKWESKWHKPFLGKDKKTKEELIDYIKCMTITQNVKNEVYYSLSNENFSQINAYIEDTMTATTFSNYKKEASSSRSETLTSELIYYWMVSYEIPFECQKWHLNRLLTLIRICGVKNNSNNKMSKKDLLSNNRSLNAARRNQLKTKG